MELKDMSGAAEYSAPEITLNAIAVENGFADSVITLEQLEEGYDL